MMLAALFGTSILANAADDTSGWTYNGHLDFYYMYDFGTPGMAQGVNFRQFDVNNNQFGFAVLEVDVAKKPTAKDPFGLTANFTAGNNADIVSGFDPDGGASKLIQQLYVTYAVPNSDATIDLGKFSSWIGYEGVDSSANDNYSRSFLYTLGQPIYHAGLRGTKSITKNLTGSVYLVNGWNETQDSNGGKSYGATIGYTPSSATSITANYYGGEEGSGGLSGIAFTSAGARTISLGDLVITHQLTKSIKLALNADYADAKGFDGTAGGKWNGIVGYVKDQFTDKFAGTIRYENFNDPDGLRGTGNPGRFDSLTGTLDYQMTKDALFRLELRYDTSNAAVFNADNGSVKNNRTTLCLSHVLKF